MEVKIGVQHVGREIVLETDASAVEVLENVKQALASGEVLSLTDAKGRQVVVPVSALAYVETGTEAARTVGFGIA